MRDRPCRPIVFLGPSISGELARRTLPEAEYRPPIRRGDLDDVPAGTVVGIIDGVFDQHLAISPDEIRAALARGVVVYGAASMGALRATEIRNVIGVGRIFEMYARGDIERDDEVALLFDPETYRTLTEPLVNIRYAVERLVRSATLSRESGEALIRTAAKLHFTERTYPNVIRQSALAHNTDADDIIRLLRNFDLKREDARFLLETIAAAGPVTAQIAPVEVEVKVADPAPRVRRREDAGAGVLIWESGDAVEFPALVRFLMVTGAFESYARNALARLRMNGMLSSAMPATIPLPRGERVGERAGDAAQSLLDATRMQWGWESPEEAHLTMRDLGLGLADAADSLHAEAAVARTVVAVARRPTESFSKALRAELWLNELALKREVLRLGALTYFARLGALAGPPAEAELMAAKRCVARLRGVMQWPHAQSDLTELGLSADELANLLSDLALARRAARPIVAALERRSASASAPPQRATPRGAGWRALGLALVSSPKAAGSNRFVLTEDEGTRHAERIAEQMGVVRIGLVGELSPLGVHVAQAFGERSGWSSSFSSGKAETREGARVGSIMEEAELHAQDAYTPAVRLRSAFAVASTDLPLVDPHTLALPFDSRYTDALEIDWSECVDLLGNRTVLVPSACLTGERWPDDIYYSPRLGGKVFSSSGLGSGFSLAEAAVHAAAECIERHAQRLVELELDNPGGVGVNEYWFIDEESLPQTPKRIVEKYRQAGMSIRILDMTSDIAVPTFYVRVFEDPFLGVASTSSDGFACHPDPTVAVTMALLEAAQTKAGFIAGGREDYSLQARSLGRHERPRTSVPRSQVFWFSGDRPVRDFAQTPGLVSRDVLEELEWIADRVEEAGYPQLLIADFTMARIAPAYAVRVLIPGSETTNPLATGPRGRATCIRDLLPRAAWSGPR